MTRIERLKGRIARLEQALHEYDEGGVHFQFRGRLVSWVIAELRKHGVDIDPDHDGALSEHDIEAALEHLEDLIDAQTALPEPFDGLLDLGVDAMLDVVSAIVFRKKNRLEHRLARLKARLDRLEGA